MSIVHKRQLERKGILFKSNVVKSDSQKFLLPYECYICGCKLRSEGNAVTHSNNPHHIQQMNRFSQFFNIIPPLSQIDSVKLACKFCNSQPTWEQSKEHIQQHNVVSWLKPDNLSHTFFRHFVSQHRNSVFKCNLCDFMYGSWYHAIDHIKDSRHTNKWNQSSAATAKYSLYENSDFQFNQLICNRIFIGESQLYHCHVCNLSFQNIEKTNVHIASIEHKSLLSRDTNEIFQFKTKIPTDMEWIQQSSMLIVMKDKIYCKICDVYFMELSEINPHMETHKPDKEKTNTVNIEKMQIDSFPNPTPKPITEEPRVPLMECSLKIPRYLHWVVLGHKVIVTKNALHCTICNKTMFNNSNVERHLQSHFDPIWQKFHLPTGYPTSAPGPKEIEVIDITDTSPTGVSTKRIATTSNDTEQTKIQKIDHSITNLSNKQESLPISACKFKIPEYLHWIVLGHKVIVTEQYLYCTLCKKKLYGTTSVEGHLKKHLDSTWQKINLPPGYPTNASSALEMEKVKISDSSGVQGISSKRNATTSNNMEQTKIQKIDSKPTFKNVGNSIQIVPQTIQSVKKTFSALSSLLPTPVLPNTSRQQNPSDPANTKHPAVYVTNSKFNNTGLSGERPTVVTGVNNPRPSLNSKPNLVDLMKKSIPSLMSQPVQQPGVSQASKPTSAIKPTQPNNSKINQPVNSPSSDNSIKSNPIKPPMNTFIVNKPTFSNQPVNPVNQPTNSGFNQPPLSYSMSQQPLNNPLIQPLGSLMNLPLNNPMNRPLINPMTQSLNNPMNQPLISPMTQSLNNPMNRPLISPMTQSLNNPTNQPLISPMTQSLNNPMNQRLISPMNLQPSNSQYMVNQPILNNPNINPINPLIQPSNQQSLFNQPMNQAPSRNSQLPSQNPLLNTAIMTKLHKANYLFFTKNEIYEMAPEKKRRIILSSQLSFFVKYSQEYFIYCVVCEKSIAYNLQNVYEHWCSSQHNEYLTKLEEDDKQFSIYPNQFSCLALSKEFMVDNQSADGASTSNSKMFTCCACDDTVPDQDSILLQHFQSEKHEMNVKRFRKHSDEICKEIFPLVESCWYSIEKYSCWPCQKLFSHEIPFAEHLESKKHLSTLQAMSVQERKKYFFDSCAVCGFLWYGDEEEYTKHCHQDSIHKKLTRNIEDRIDHMPEEATRLFSTTEQFISELINEVYKVKHDLGRESELIRSLELAVQRKFPEAKAYPFGSRVTGLGLMNSDIDIFLDCGGFYNGNKEQPADLIDKIHHCLKLDSQAWSVENIIETSRTPIIKVYHSHSQLKCDVSFSNGLSVENSKLLKCYLDAYPQCKEMILFIKKWLFLCHISGSRYITNYAMSWFVIFYLQTRKLLPSVASLMKDNPRPKTVFGWQVGSREFTVPKTSLSISTKELLKGFFSFYADFDYRFNAACPLLGVVKSKKEFLYLQLLPDEMKSYVELVSNEKDPEFFRIDSPMCIQDPYDLSHNLTKGVKKVIVNRFRKLCGKSVKLLSSD